MRHVGGFWDMFVAAVTLRGRIRCQGIEPPAVGRTFAMTMAGDLHLSVIWGIISKSSGKEKRRSVKRVRVQGTKRSWFLDQHETDKNVGLLFLRKCWRKGFY
ncbi:hypothetical protein DesyoDRAFT_2085 [Desulfosporosinus youngiae DSM 17734]|uniref:Uncharacterized protein n=1 Tax=Desulfosporosinus youngiae DSM 17734 TaxID=768710 RepID=H5XU83_9FIRM|nr:hypothetical protein DesyoDRAFT_2085 [Desulfosporosinus youngiae DSM 17734]